MRILVDECAPRALSVFPLRQGHHCRTVQEFGWSGKQNGELLDLAESAFDVLVTLDSQLRHQQRLAGRKLAILVLAARTNRLPDLTPLFPSCLAALEKIRPWRNYHRRPIVGRPMNR